MLATLVTQPWHLYATLGLLVGGGSVCLGYTGQSLFLPNWFVRRRGFAMSLAFSGVGVGSIILLPWIQVVIGRAGWRAACWTLAVLVLVLLVPLNLLLRKRPEDMGLEPDGDRRRPGRPRWRREPSNVVDEAWVAVDWTLARAIRTSRFWWIAVGYFCGLFSWYAVQVHQTRYLVEMGFTPTLRRVGARLREPRRHPGADRCSATVGPDRARVGVDGRRAGLRRLLSLPDPAARRARGAAPLPHGAVAGRARLRRSPR